MCYAVGIDPGPVTSGVVIVEVGSVNKSVVYSDSKFINTQLVSWLSGNPIDSESYFFNRGCSCLKFEYVALEKIVAYGIRVGQETFDTAWWAGRIYEASIIGGMDTRMLSRPDVKVSLYGSTTYTEYGSDRRKAVDTSMLKSCIYRFFEPYGGGSNPYKGKKTNPGPLYLVRGSHAWDALAVAIASFK